jgi:hypothetical protein
MANNSLSAARAQIQQGEKAIQEYYTNRNYLKVEPGYNDFRIFPALDGGSFMYLKHTHQMDIESTRDGKTEIKQKKVFNSKTHGGTEKDIVDEYVKFVTDRVKEKVGLENISPKEKEEKEKKWLTPVLDWKDGLKPQFNWVMYALKLNYSQSDGKEISSEKGIIDFPFTVGKKIDSLAASYDRPGAVASIDPFSDQNEGGKLVINYDKSKKGGDKYVVTLDTNGKRPITQDEMAWLKDQDSLKSMFTLSYRRKDFNMALDGLRRFDQKHGYNVFKSDTWLAIVEEISNYYPEDEEKTIGQSTIADSPSPLDYKAKEEEKPEELSDEQKERGDLLSIIEDEKLLVTVHPEHTNEQIKAFIEEERKVVSDMKKTEEEGFSSDKIDSLF